MDDIKGLITKHLQTKKVVGVQGDALCAMFASVVRPAVVKHLEAAGFKKISGYYSHRHARNVSVMMMRPTTKLEWESGKATFPAKKRGVVAKKKKQ